MLQRSFAAAFIKVGANKGGGKIKIKPQYKNQSTKTNPSSGWGGTSVLISTFFLYTCIPGQQFNASYFSNILIQLFTPSQRSYILLCDCNCISISLAWRENKQFPPPSHNNQWVHLYFCRHKRSGRQDLALKAGMWHQQIIPLKTGAHPAYRRSWQTFVAHCCRFTKINSIWELVHSAFCLSCFVLPSFPTSKYIGAVQLDQTIHQCAVCKRRQQQRPTATVQTESVSMVAWP